MTTVRCGIVAAAWIFAASPASAQSRSGDTGARSVADLRWGVATLDGVGGTLERFRGRVLVINSWATWCEPCVAELASLHALRTAVPDSGIVFALIATERREPVTDFVRRRRVTLPVYLEASPAPAVFGFAAVPTTWIIDRRGRIAFRHRGAADWNTPGMRAMLRALLAEAASDSGAFALAPAPAASGNRAPRRP